MSGIIVAGVIAVILFAAAYFPKRRFGLLGLALTAGATLSALWAADLAPLVEQAGIRLLAPPLESVIAVIITLLPATVSLFSGLKVTGKSQRLIGALMFSLLGVAFLLPTLSSVLVLEAQSQQVFQLLADYRDWIITVGVAYALLDVLTTKIPKPEKH